MLTREDLANSAGAITAAVVSSSPQAKLSPEQIAILYHSILDALFTGQSKSPPMKISDKALKDA